MRAFLADYVAQLRAVLDELDPDRLQQLADRVNEARMAGQTVFIIGNGGSAATAWPRPSHWSIRERTAAAAPCAR